jgi:hypothetical protein
VRCPKCREHVTPLGAWSLEYVDDPGQCRHCGVRLLPSHRALWYTPLFAAVAVVGFAWVVLVYMLAAEMRAAGGARQAVVWFVVGRLAVGVGAALVTAYAYWVVWNSGTYRLDESDHSEATEAGAQLDPYDLEQLLRGAIAAEKDGDLRRAIGKYQSIAEYAGGSHPNAELARERIRDLQARLDAQPPAPVEAPPPQRVTPPTRPWDPRR